MEYTVKYKTEEPVKLDQLVKDSEKQVGKDKKTKTVDKKEAKANSKTAKKSTMFQRKAG